MAEALATPASSASQATPAGSGWRRWPAWTLGILLVAIIAVRFAQPIEDGDIFWHMAYGQQMVSQHTLRVDHSQFSWMPASNDVAYVAWTGELLFLAVWKVFRRRWIIRIALRSRVGGGRNAGVVCAGVRIVGAS